MMKNPYDMKEAEGLKKSKALLIEKYERTARRRMALGTAKEVLGVLVRFLCICVLILFLGVMISETITGELETVSAETEELAELRKDVNILYDKVEDLMFGLEEAEGLFLAGMPSPRGEHIDFKPALSAEDRNLLERIVAGEARGEPYDGLIAVAEVVLNRAELWGMTPMEVMTAEGQFYTGYDGPISNAVKDAVTDALRGDRVFTDYKVTHFHEASITPYWAESKTFAGRIGNHKFYY